MMALVQRDYILRLIEAVAAALARISRRRESGDLQGARREAQIATVEFLGPLASIVGSVDSRTAADLIGEGWRLAAWAQLLAADAETLRLMDQSEAASRNDRRAAELLLEVHLRGEELDADAAAALEALKARVPGESVDARYRDAWSAWRNPGR
jgi:hypothetical protein